MAPACDPTLGDCELLADKDAKIAELEALLVAAIQTIRETEPHRGESNNEILHGLGERADAKDEHAPCQ